MQSRNPFYFMVSLLFVLGFGLVIYRAISFQIPMFPGEQVKSWNVEAKISFIAQNAPAQVNLALPNDPAFDLLAENASSAGYGFEIVETDKLRQAQWSIRQAEGLQILYYKLTLVPSRFEMPLTDIEPDYPNTPLWSATEKPAAEAIINEAWAHSANELSYAKQLLKAILDPQRTQNIELLLLGYNVNDLLVKLLHSKNIPAHVTRGLYLEDQRRRQTLESFVEIHTADQWHLLDTRTGKVGRPEQILLWERQGKSVLDVIGGRQSQVTFSMLQDTRSALATSISMLKNETSLGFSLYELPLEEQSLFKGILLIPVGVLMVVFLRVLIGVKTSGTFMPVLIALAFIQTTLITGLVGFLSIVACGLLIRGYLSKLNLLLISRISAVIIVVIGIIGGMTILSYHFGLTAGMTITFFPMIILAWTIERMSILWEEEGASEVFLQGGGSLAVATLAYLAMSASWVQHWVFNFLGIHLVILALVLLMGQYTGFKLLELKRFKPLADARNTTEK